LQNIPIRTALGNEIRKAFVAKKGYKLIGIDYSQIELRLLAHFSGDKYLIEAFLNNEDIHLQTAIKLFGKEQAGEKRNIAKSINFGILYGMGSRKLAKLLGIPGKEAKEYIESYFACFENVQETIQSIKDFIQKNGYVETLLKRRRLFDFTNASEFESSNYLRAGVNNVFQGSGADLIKMAMNKIHDEYIDNDDVQILIQIHDETIIQAPESIALDVANRCANIMENIVSLDVPLKADINIGINWGELK
jgi:DNA polymerase-1